MTFHADEPHRSWVHYNTSIITTIITNEDLDGPNRTALPCWAHKHGIRVVYMGFGDNPKDRHVALLHNATYREAWLQAGLSWVEKYPWVDGVNIDLERFSTNESTRNASALTSLICAAQAALHAKSLRLHSQDVAVVGSYNDFDVRALSRCMDFLLPMAYCSPKSTTVAGPTIRLDSLRTDFSSGGGWAGVERRKIILGLPFCEMVMLSRSVALPISR